MRRLLFLALLLCLRLAPAQTADSTHTPASHSPAAQSEPQSEIQSEPQLSPQSAYDQAARPLDIVRRDPGNWSDVEITAFNIATANAEDQCGLRSPSQFTGEDLLAFSRLCAFGNVWLPVQQAAASYLIAYNKATPAEKLTNFPNLATAFDYEVQADLHLNKSDEAFGTCQTMLRTVPYDDQASEATNATVRYVQLIHTDQALALLAQRQPILLALIKTHPTPATAGATPATTPTTPPPSLSAHPPLPIHELYADAIQLPAMQQFDAHPDAAAASFAELESSLPPNLSPDDEILTAASRRQYKLLGAPLPPITTWAWLLQPTPTLPKLDRNLGAGTELFLFPEWCAQCVTMGKQFMYAALSLNQSNVRFFGMLAQTAPPDVATPPAKSPARGRPAASKPEAPTVPSKSTPAELLAGTPTLIVPSQTVDTFVATDYPLVVATDHDGIVRALIVAPNTALQPGGLVEQIAEHILSRWPPPAPAHQQPPAPPNPPAATK